MLLIVSYLFINDKNYKKLILKRSLFAILLIATILFIASSNISANISPDYVNYKKEPGECYTETKTVEIPGTTIKVDVIFSFDLTIGMSEILNEAKAKISQIMNDLINNNNGVSFNFGVISYSDYPAFYESCGYRKGYGVPTIDYAYLLDQPLTNVTTDVTTAINGLSLRNGFDAPEDYTRIFYESYNDSNIGWRIDSQKILINFADSVPHDCNLNESIYDGTWSTGADPGPDAIILNDDDLDLQEVLATMNSHDITLIECHSSTNYLDYWDYWTGITGGSVNYTSSSNFISVVEDAITNKLKIPKIYDLHLEVTTSGYENWLSSVVPISYPEVSMGATITFEETICVPDDIPPGEYTFNVSAVDGDGNNYGNQTNVVIINSPPIANDDDATTDEDVSVWIDVLANDTDFDGALNPATVVVTSGPTDGTTSVNLTSGEIMYIPDPDFHGDDSFTYTVDDDDGATSNEATVTITVLSVNDPPVITTSDVTTAVEDVLYSVDYDATDVDLDVLVWSLLSDAGFLSINPSTGVLSGTPVNDDVGSYYVNVSVDDGNGGFDFSNFTLIVSDVNDPPYTPINPNPNNGEDGISINPSLSVLVDDPDGDFLNVSFYNSANTLIGVDTNVPSGGTASVSWSGRSYSTTYSWYAVANDSEYFTTSDTWSFTTRDEPNPPPPLNQKPIADASAGAPYFGVVGESITFDGSNSYDPDTDGSIVSWHWDFDDGTYGNGETTTHSYSNNGTYSVTLTVTDNIGAKGQVTFDVIISTANTPPENLIVDGPLTGKKNIYYTYTASATDSDINDRLRYIFDWGDGKTTTSDVVESGITVSESHNWSTYGVYDVTVTVMDNLSASDSTTFTVLIDVIVINGDIKGYIIDEDSTDPFDIFNNSDTGDETDVEKENTDAYLIDSDNDGVWDHAYDPEWGLLKYPEYVYRKYYEVFQIRNATPGFELIYLLAMIAILTIIFKRRRKK